MANYNPIPSRKRLLELFVYDPESGHLYCRNSRGYRQDGERVGWRSSSGYRLVTVDDIQYREHRIIFRMCTGIDAGDFTVDHANRVRHDNRISNLRVASRRQQNANKSGVKGYYFFKEIDQFVVDISGPEGKRSCGCWPTEEIARAVYATEAAKVHGEFAPDPPPNPFGFINTHWGKFSDGSITGVSFRKDTGKWTAYIDRFGKRKQLGSFTTQQEAREARLAAEEELAAVQPSNSSASCCSLSCS